MIPNPSCFRALGVAGYHTYRLIDAGAVNVFSSQVDAAYLLYRRKRKLIRYALDTRLRGYDKTTKKADMSIYLTPAFGFS